MSPGVNCMNLYKELVNGLGYAVCPIENMQCFKKMRDSFIDKMNSVI